MMKKTYNKKPRSKKRGPVVAKKVSYDGINFASGLERYMYMALKKANIRAKYEGETFVLVNGFHFENEVYEVECKMPEILRDIDTPEEYEIEINKNQQN